jgi:hypothetical protein
MRVKVSVNDSQVPYWEGAKLTAKIRALNTGRNPLLLKSIDLRLSLCAALCCRLPLLVAPNRQEKGNISARLRQLDPIMLNQRARRP